MLDSQLLFFHFCAIKYKFRLNHQTVLSLLSTYYQKRSIKKRQPIEYNFHEKLQKLIFLKLRNPPKYVSRDDLGNLRFLS